MKEIRFRFRFGFGFRFRFRLILLEFIVGSLQGKRPIICHPPSFIAPTTGIANRIVFW